MRRILLVHDEIYLDRALQDVTKLIEVEQRYAGTKGATDLLAVMVMSLSEIPQLYSEEQACGAPSVTHEQTLPLFRSNSISVNGIWLLLTIDQPDLIAPTPRKKALSQALHILRARGCFEHRQAVFPVFPKAKLQKSMTDALSYLQTSHPDLDATYALMLNNQERSWKLTRVTLPPASEGSAPVSSKVSGA